MAEFDFGEIKRKSIGGVITLTSRTFFLQIISFVAIFILTILLSPSVFGVFFVVSATISFLSYFSDIGLAAALIQKKEALKPEDLKTTFTIQQILVSLIVAISLLGSNFVASFYNLDKAGLWLFRTLVFSFFLSSLKTIPSILLERKLDFNRLVIPQIVETSLFYLVAVFLAWRGFGISSFTWAVLVRGFSGLLVIYILSPWMPSFSFNKNVAKKLLSFGIPFQANSFLALIKDDLLTIYLGKILPFSEIGFIGWAKKWAEMPLRLIMDNVIKVSFPTYARIQSDKALLKKGINKAIFFLSLVILPMAVGLLIVITPLIKIVPKYSKWEPALPAFYLFIISSVLASFSTPLTNALNAIGKIKTTLKLMIFWTVLTWILVPFLVAKFGFNGVALAAVIVGSTLILVIFVSKRHLSFSVLRNVYPAFYSSLFMFGALFWLKGQTSNNYWQLLILVILGTITYTSFLLIFFRKRVVSEIRSVIVSLKS